MTDTLTMQHALSKKSVPELRELGEVNNVSDLDPKKGKDEMIKQLLPHISTDQYQNIIDEAFNQPSSRYHAHLGVFNVKKIKRKTIENKIEEFNATHGYDTKLEDFKKNTKENMTLIDFTDESMLLHYTFTTRKVEYDPDTMESKLVTYAKKIRVKIKPKEKKVSVFSGDRDLFNSCLTALTLIFNDPIVPLEANKTGISEYTRGGFSFHTVKVIDFIYFGLSKLGKVGEVYEINLDQTKNKDRQKVKVQGYNLLKDQSICYYLYIYRRDLVGVKMKLNFNLDNVQNEVYVEIGIRDGRVKISIRKDNYSMEQLNHFFNLLENNTHNYLKRTGLINEDETKNLLGKIIDTALEGRSGK